MSEEARRIMLALQCAVNEEMQRKAKLGYKAVVAGDDGEVMVLPASRVVRKMRAAGLLRLASK